MALSGIFMPDSVLPLSVLRLTLHESKLIVLGVGHKLLDIYVYIYIYIFIYIYIYKLNISQ